MEKITNISIYNKSLFKTSKNIKTQNCLQNKTIKDNISFCAKAGKKKEYSKKQRVLIVITAIVGTLIGLLILYKMHKSPKHFNDLKNEDDFDNLVLIPFCEHNHGVNTETFDDLIE